MSAQTYLGAFPVDIAETEFKDHSPAEWALYLLQQYGGIDGSHHKNWVLDQVARVLLGAPVEVKERRWTDHPPEYAVAVGEPPEAYTAWVEKVRGPFDDELGEYAYDYEEGTPP